MIIIFMTRYEIANADRMHPHDGNLMASYRQSSDKSTILGYSTLILYHFGSVSWIITINVSNPFYYIPALICRDEKMD